MIERWECCEKRLRKLVTKWRHNRLKNNQNESFCLNLVERGSASLIRTAVVCISAAFFLCGCEEQILHDLTEHEANKVLSRLHVGKLPATKVLQ